MVTSLTAEPVRPCRPGFNTQLEHFLFLGGGGGGGGGGYFAVTPL